MSLTKTHPHLREEWDDGRSFDSFTHGSNVVVNWRCRDCQLPYSAKISKRARKSKPTGCPYCSNRKIWIGRNDLKSQYPEIAQELDDDRYSADELTMYSSKEVWWKCSSGHRYQKRVMDRTKKEARDICALYTSLTKEWSPNNTKTPHEVTFGSDFKANWICKDCGYEYNMVVKARTIKGRGCPVCANRIVIAGMNDLTITDPKIAKQWSPRNAKQATAYAANSREKVGWECDKHGYWEAIIHNRTDKGSGCPVCSGSKVWKDETDLLSQFPEIAAEWSPRNKKKPDKVSYRSNFKSEWVCSANSDHVWVSTVQVRTKKGYGCPNCNNRISKAEQELLDYIRSLGFEATRDRKVLKGKELDIYVPEKQLAIEFNGLYWHSEQQGKHKTYHLEKYLTCKEAGVNLIQIWEDNYLLNPGAVKKVIKSRLNKGNIGCNNFKVRDIFKKEAKKFLNENALFSIENKCDYYYGLMQDVDNEFIAIIGFNLDTDNNAIKIEHYDSLINSSAVFRMLLEEIERSVTSKHVSIDRVVAYSYNEIPLDEVYADNSFMQTEIAEPKCFYIRSSNRENRLNYSIQNYKEREDLVFKEGLNEHELADLNGLVRIWSAGSSRWEKRL